METNGEELEKVVPTTYHGSNISKDGTFEEEVNTRIGKTGRAFWSLNKVWNSKTVSLKNRMKLYNSCVSPPAQKHGA